MADQTYAYWKRCLLDPYRPDVFVHAWKSRDATVSDQRVFAAITRLYNPVVLCTDAQRFFDTSAYRDRVWPHRTTPHGVLSQWYSCKKAIKSKKNYEDALGFTYDVVIRARFDYFLRKIDLETNDAVNTPRAPTLDNHIFQWEGRQEVGINDQFAWGSSSVMDIYSTLFDKVPEIYHNDRVDFCSELLLKAHLLKNDISVKQHDLIDNGIARIEGVLR
jgi:hypothetical protein